jgi:hypothetical protein
MASVLAAGVICYSFEPWTGRTKAYDIDIYWFIAKHALLMSKCSILTVDCCFSELAERKFN